MSARTIEPPGARTDAAADLPVCHHFWRLFFVSELGMVRDEVSHCCKCGTAKHETRVDGKVCVGYPRYMIVEKLEP